MTEDEQLRRMTADKRRDQILDAALEMVSQDGIQNLRRQELTEHLGISKNLINHHFGDMDALREEIVRLAVERRHLRVIGFAIAAGYATALDADDDLKEAALQSLIEG